MALNAEQKIAYTDTFQVFRAAPAWGSVLASAPGYFIAPAATTFAVIMGGEGAQTQAVQEQQHQKLACEIAAGVRAEDIVKGLTGNRAGLFFNVRRVTQNALANEIECVLEETHDLPTGVS